MPDRRVTVTLDANVARYLAQLGVASAATKAFAHNVDHAGEATDLLSQNFRSVASRLKLAIDVFGAVGPALVPIGAVAVPAVSGLANAFGVAALSGGTAILAFKGVGDALDKLNKARINPTTTNLKNARIAMEQIGHEGRVMVRTLANLKDEFQGLRDSARSGLFPGVNEAIESLATRIPEVEVILRRIGEVTGDMLAKGADSLASEEWDDFFLFLHNDVPKAIAGLAESVGNLAHGFAELWMNTTPLNNSFTEWLISSTAAFDEWATKLSDSNGLTEFLSYVNEVGPEVSDLLGAWVMMLLDIAEAAAPIGAALLPVLTTVLRIVSAIADSDFGTPLLALLTLTSAMRLFDRVASTQTAQGIRTLNTDLRTIGTTMRSTGKMIRQASLDAKGVLRTPLGHFVSAKDTANLQTYAAAIDRTKSTMKDFAKTAGRTGAVVGGMMLVQSGLTEQMGVTNTVMGASIGAMAGWEGALAGGAIGLLFDIAEAGHESTLSVEALTAAMNEQTGALQLAGYEQIATELQFFQEGLDGVGISLTDATAAVAAGGPELDAMVARVDALIAVYDEYVANISSGDSTATYGGPDITALDKLRDALTGSNDKVNEAAKALDAKKAAQEAAAGADDQAASALGRYNNELGDTIHTLMGLNGLLKERDLTLAYNKALLDLNKAVKDNGEVWDKTSKKGIDNNEKLNATITTAVAQFENYRDAGRDAAAQSILDKALSDIRTFVKLHPKATDAARDLIRDLRRADRQSTLSRAIQQLHAFKQEHPGVEGATEGLVARLKNLNKKSMLNEALADLRAFKLLNPEAAAAVQPLIDKIVEAKKKAKANKVKPEVEVDSPLRKLDRLQQSVDDVKQKKPIKAEVDTAEALSRLTHLQATINNLRGNDVTINVNTVYSHQYAPGAAKPRATGGPVKAGETYIVGERRPELFMPTTDGRILSSVPSRTALDGGGATTGSDGGGKGSDSGGKPLLINIIEAMLGGGFGPGMLRHFEKMLNQIQRGLTKHHGKWTKELKEQAHDLFKEIREAERDRAQAIRQAFKSFEGDLADGGEAIREQMVQLKHDLREAGGVWNKALNKHAQRILGLAVKYDAQAAALEAEQQTLEDLTAAADDTAQAMASFKDQVTGNFSNDPFNTPQGLAGVFAQLTTDTTQATAFNSVLEQLKAMGLDGPAYQALAASGDLVTAQQLLASGMVDPFEQAFAERTAALTTLGNNAGETVFGQQIANQNAAIDAQNVLIADSTKTMAALQAAVDRQEAVLMTLAGINQKVHNGAYNGTYDGVKDAMVGAGRAMTRNGG